MVLISVLTSVYVVDSEIANCLNTCQNLVKDARSNRAHGLEEAPSRRQM